jgi:hypothetical protein
MATNTARRVALVFTHHLESAGDRPRGCRTGNHGLPRFRRASFATAYPFGQVFLADPAVPVDVRLDASNPLIPSNADERPLRFS